MEPKPVAPGSNPKLRGALPLPSGKSIGVRPIGPPAKNVAPPPQATLEQPETLTAPFVPKRPPLATEVDEDVETLVKALDPIPDPQIAAKPPAPPPAPAPAAPAPAAPAPAAPAPAAPAPAAPAPLPLPIVTPPKALVPLAIPQPLSSHLTLEEGKTIAGKYRLEKPAGFGGMAQLWVAKNASTEAEVCIKILVPESSDEESVERFRREAYAAARLSHRAIVRIFDLVELDERGEVVKSGKPHALGIVMELLRGETLGDQLMKKNSLPLEDALDIFLPVLSALGHAHRAGVVHRDLKPDNIFLATDPDGHVGPKVLDFGVSKLAGSGNTANPLTLDGVMLGTPSFMSPEQARGARNIDERSDVFSAGIVLYMMLTGKNPFEDESFHSVVQAIIDRNPLPIPGLPDEIWAVITKALAKDPNQRYADATELAIALRRASGRKVESGNHLIPSSTRMVAARGPNDSNVSVPPVGSSSLTPPDELNSLMPPAGVPPPGRQRALRIVGAVVALSAIVVVTAIVRSVVSQPDAPSSDPTAKVIASQHPTAPATTSAPAPPPSLPPPPSATATAEPAETSAPVELPVTPPPSATVSAAASGVIPRKRAAQPPGSATVKPGEEPKNARDPGF